MVLAWQYEKTYAQRQIAGIMLEGRSQTVRKTKTTQLELDSARKKIGPAFWFTSVRYTFK